MRSVLVGLLSLLAVEQFAMSQGAEAASVWRAKRGAARVATASWYGNECRGRRTASGARFDPNHLTAAHRTLPLGTKLIVANPRNGKCCTVTVDDRGPFVRGRQLDLSRAAAQRIGMKGVQPVVYYPAGSSGIENLEPAVQRRPQIAFSPPRRISSRSSRSVGGRQYVVATRSKLARFFRYIRGLIT